MKVTFLVPVLILASVLETRAAELSGQVRDVCGRSIPGAVVALENLRSGVVFRTTAITEGRYAFHDVPAGDSWVLSVRAFGSVRAMQDVVLREDAPLERNVPLLPDVAIKETRAATGADPSFQFHKYSAIGFVMAPNGDAVAGAIVTLRPLGADRSNRLLAQCTTDELGRFYVLQWNAGAAVWSLSVESSNFAPYSQPDLMLQPDEPRVIDLHLAAK